MKYDFKGHPMSYKTTFMPKYFYHIGPIFMKIYKNADIMKTQFFFINVTFMLWRSFVLI